MFGKLIKPPTEPRPAPKAVLGKKGISPSVLAADLHILGNLVSDGVIDIDGKIDGNVKAHTVNIRTNGLVRGDVMADIVHVHGAVEGVIKGKSVTLYHTAKVVGMIMHESITIEDGAFVDGKFKRTDKIIVSDEQDEGSSIPRLEGPRFASADELAFAAEFDDEPASEEEVRVLENLRLVR